MTDDVSSNVSTIEAFMAAWSNLDADQLVTFFTEDGTYHNMPARPVSGHDDLRRFIGGFLTNWDKTDWEILHVFGSGNVVVAERLDRTVVGGKAVDLPCCGIFEMRDGKIAVWRDYFDMATFTNALS